jgi:hypothetical protein
MAKGKKTTGTGKKGSQAARRQSKRLQQNNPDDEYDESEVESSDNEGNFGKLTADKKTKKLQEQALLIAQLKAKVTNEKVKAHQPSTPEKKSNLTDKESIWFRGISDANRKYNWNKVKFCNSDNKSIALMANIFDKWNLKEYKHLKGQAREDAKAQWVAENQEWVRMAMNNVQNYAQSQVRGWVVARLNAGQLVPTPDQIRLCALRDKSIETNEELQEVFRLYHQELITKILGKEHCVGRCYHRGAGVLPLVLGVLSIQD